MFDWNYSFIRHESKSTCIKNVLKVLLTSFKKMYNVFTI